jgi:hypothetical protein
LCGDQIRLDSGDVLVFGGKSRTILHAVTKIHPVTVNDFEASSAIAINEPPSSSSSSSTTTTCLSRRLCSGLTKKQFEEISSVLSDLVQPEVRMPLNKQPGCNTSMTGDAAAAASEEEESLRVNFRLNLNFREK